MKPKFYFLAVMISFSLLHPIVGGNWAHAKRKAKMRAYSFITFNDKASQGDCDGETKVPRKLKPSKSVPHAGSYLGSEKLESEFKDKADEGMWKHYFRDKGSCNASLGKTPLVTPNAPKADPADLPPEESSGDDESGDQPDAE